MESGPADDGTQALYYTTYGGGGQVRRISYNGIPLGKAQVHLPIVRR